VLQPQRDDRLAQLGGQAAAARRVAAVQQQLGDLLRDRRAALHDLPLRQIAAKRAAERDRIDAGMEEEPVVFGCDRRRDERRRQVGGRQRHAPRPIGRPRLEERDAVAVEHDRRFAVRRKQV
jgi:hypothetical protein